MHYTGNSPPKTEPFKLWLAQVGRERIEETIDPALTIADQAKLRYNIIEKQYAQLLTFRQQLH